MIFCSNQSDRDQNDSNHYFLNKNVYIAAFGKASLQMSISIEKLIEKKGHLVKGIAILPYNDALENNLISRSFNESLKGKLVNQIYPCQNSKIDFYYAAKNNMPDMNSVNAALKIHEMCKSLKKEDILLTLISGGGSALLALPQVICNDQSMEFNLNLKINTIKTMVNAGATINDLNRVRSCLSQLKCGKLAELASPCQIISLIISDVINDPIDIIASGPTCSSFVSSSQSRIEYNNYQMALEIFENYKIEDKIPPEVVNYLKEKSDTFLNNTVVLEKNMIKSYNFLIGNNKMACQAILNEISNQNLDYDYSRILTNSLNGEAKIVGALFACFVYILTKYKSQFEEKNFSVELCVKNLIMDLENINFDQVFTISDISSRISLIHEFLNSLILDNEFRTTIGNTDKKTKNFCLVFGGETTVTGDLMNANNFKGGRCQEMTLAFEFTLKKIVSYFKNDIKNCQFNLLFSSFGSDGIDGI